MRHSAKQYVSGEHHVNTVEGFWSQFKRSVRGTHVHISRKHMWKYLAEFRFRYNNRKAPGAMFGLLMRDL